MIITLLWQPGAEWSERVAERLPPDVTVLRPASSAEAEELMLSLAADLAIVELPHLTANSGRLIERLCRLGPEMTVLCVTVPEVIEQARLADGAQPDLWLDISGGEQEIDRCVREALQSVQLAQETRAQRRGQLASDAPGLVATANARTPAESALHKLVGGLAAGFDLQRLLDVYVEAVGELTGCGSYCLLWRASADDCYRVVRSLGLHTAVAEQGRLLLTDGLPTWYRRQRRVITHAEVAGHAVVDDLMAQLAREMDTFGGCLAVPVLDSGHLWGILLLGEKVAGGPYTVAEMETIFVLSTQIGIAAHDIELHQELSRNKEYIDKVLSTMNGGVVVLGRDHKVLVYNQYAANTLGTAADQVINHDLRSLPSPLGDLAYAALEAGQVLEGHETPLPGTPLVLRVSTSQLTDDEGRSIGGLLFFEDITTEKELAEQKMQAERMAVLDNVVARLAQQIRTPLSSIRTFAELLPERHAEADFREFWSDTVRKEIVRINELISQMMTLVQGPSGRPEAVAPRQLVQNALTKLEESDEIAWCQTEIEEHGPLPDVTVEPVSTAEALLYLLQFARGQTKNWVEIAVGPVEMRDGDARLCISFAAESTRSDGTELSSLLDPLYALEHPDADLGPAVSQRILERQGGSVEAVLENGNTYIKVFLPVSTSKVAHLAEVT